MPRWPLAAAQLTTSLLLAQPAPPALRIEMLVSTTWLAEHLKDPNLVLLHVADTFADYKRGHIPGARFLATGKFVDNTGKLGSELPAVEALTRTFSELGLTEKSRVVLYATAWMPNAARAYLTLDYLGMGERTALLDGGVEQWLAEDRPVTMAVPVFPASSFVPKPKPAVRAALEEAKQAVEGSGVAASQLLDSRPARRYTAGHLGGARNLYWMDTLRSEEHPTFLPPDQLRALLASRGLVPGRKVVTYCEVGLQAAHGYFLLKYLGYDTALYDGSYQEWSGAKLPVSTGEGK
ncbi:MAG: sulfurtransferase [Holophagaceae bacterium]|uniref:Sulfurtransferase n=1 Tax=Candidatus Geothrix skivensis TaxID=2954439 RepID=A0A9D7XML8_9BACT|nr:sulfurtransferase [Candidatus Geothrix skivensis]